MATVNGKTIQRIVEVPLEDLQIEAEKYNTNLKRNGYGATDVINCIICGKRIRDVLKAKSVHLLTNGNIVSYDGDDIENSQGFFYVGSECQKRLVINFAF